ncbi:alpha/beta fold hydrolase [Sphingobacterium arenae]|uniref:Alpha/beta hydrolase n=2 Tax=Sphingobacterium arenae TaxID=1280598 RepID=A0ABR7Y5T6_9SPHI|nr:alpha/beta hydrolase [Sphingobacterium arenae]MBD1426668.1 alpha/beta hydrolase [Sphingobacterium arenae]
MKQINYKSYTVLITFVGIVLLNFPIMAQSQKHTIPRTLRSSETIYYRTVKANGHNIFYRESGSQNAPVILLLHGYPTSSHMFRNLIPILNKEYHVIAPDLLGFGYSASPARDEFEYTFENLTAVLQAFIDELNLKRFAVYVFDYGAPTGYRLMLNNPEKVTGFISQNGNAYVEGLGPAWKEVKKYWDSNAIEDRNALRGFVKEEELRFQYFTGVSDSERIAPETYTLDQFFLDRPEADEKQLDLLKDYKNNVSMYPQFQEYFRSQQPQALIVWGNRDPYFLPAGAEAYRKDIPGAIVKFYDTGHFALETHVNEIGEDILNFMETLPK